MPELSVTVSHGKLKNELRTRDSHELRLSVNLEDDFTDGGDAVPLCVTSWNPPPTRSRVPLSPLPLRRNFRSRGHNGYVLPLRAARSLARYPRGCGLAFGISPARLLARASEVRARARARPVWRCGSLICEARSVRFARSPRAARARACFRAKKLNRARFEKVEVNAPNELPARESRAAGSLRARKSTLASFRAKWSCWRIGAPKHALSESPLCPTLSFKQTLKVRVLVKPLWSATRSLSAKCPREISRVRRSPAWTPTLLTHLAWCLRVTTVNTPAHYATWPLFIVARNSGHRGSGGEWQRERRSRERNRRAEEDLHLRTSGGAKLSRGWIRQ